MQDDAALLRDYAETGSETAFAAVVRRHLDLVYSAALRQVGGDAHLAEDVVQSVFRDLARKAGAVANIPVLAGWLHTSTHYAAAKVVRAERRRRAREAEAHVMQELLNDSAHDAEWARIRPVLDETIRRLRPDDRDAILLRFFEGEAFARIGARLNLTENAARMRVERALEKLREQLTQRGIRSTSAALATVLVGQAVTAAPATLAASVTSAALVGAASSGAVVSFFQFMAVTKTQVVVAGALLLGGGAIVVQQQQTLASLRHEMESLRRQSEQVRETQLANASLARSTHASLEALRATADGLPQLRAEAAALRQKAQALSAARTAAGTGTSRRSKNSDTPPATETTVQKQGDHLPQVREHVPPVYPFELRKAGISGKVVLSVMIDSKGEIHDPQIVRATHRELEAAAIAAVKQWKFDPGVKGGRNVNARVELPIVFNVDPEEENWF